MNVKVQVFGGRLVGFTDHLGRNHRFGTMATAPMCRLDPEGKPVVTGGDPNVVAQLTKALKEAMGEENEKQPLVTAEPTPVPEEDRLKPVIPEEPRPRPGRKRKKK